jgi:hypothetical protein
MAEVRGSGRVGGAEGIAPKRSTRENKRWSQRKGSCVSSLPGVCVTGKVNCGDVSISVCASYTSFDGRGTKNKKTKKQKNKNKNQLARIQCTYAKRNSRLRTTFETLASVIMGLCTRQSSKKKKREKRGHETERRMKRKRKEEREEKKEIGKEKL